MKYIKTDVCIIGAGSGGTGCAFRLIKNGIKTVVVDKNPDFGGTMVFSGVDGWEPGVSLDGIHQLLVSELENMENACHVVETVPNCNLFYPENGDNWENASFEKYPWGLSVPTGKKYEETLGRCLSIRGNGSMKRFQFEPEAMTEAINNVLAPYKDNLQTLFGYSFVSCEKENEKITAAVVSNGCEQVKITAKYFVDASGDVVLARAAGCEHTMGSEGKEAYNEPCAGAADEKINAATYVFRIGKAEDESNIDQIPEKYKKIDIEEWKKEKLKGVVSCFVLYPNGDINVNMLPTMEGREYIDLKDAADDVGKARVYAYWEYLQKEKGLAGYTLKKIYNAGIRETYRLVGKYVLTETDVRGGGVTGSQCIAIADHALDVHGAGGMIRELEVPYEIPLECAMTKEYDNLFVACRGASFSHIAAASARLSRTMLSIGEGVGEYITKKLS